MIKFCDLDGHWDTNFAMFYDFLAYDIMPYAKNVITCHFNPNQRGFFYYYLTQRGRNHLRPQIDPKIRV